MSRIVRPQLPKVRTPQPTHGGQPARPPAASRELTTKLDEWAELGLISREQATEIRRHEGTPRALPAVRAQRERRYPLVELLAYLGGVVVLAGLVLLFSRYWPNLSTGGRLAVTGAIAVLGLPAGAVLHEADQNPTIGRLRAALWLVASAALAAFVVILVRDAGGADSFQVPLLFASVAVGFENALLWQGKDRPVQQAMMLVAAIAAVASLIAQWTTSSGAPGWAVWFCGAAVLLLGLGRRVPAPFMTEGLGAIACLVGGAMVANQWQGIGMLLVVLTGFALLLLAVIPGPARERTDQGVLAVIGAVALVEAVPGTLGYFVQQSAALTGCVTAAVGVSLVLLARQPGIRHVELVQFVGVVAVLAGPGLTWTQWHGAAPLIGVLISVAFVVAGIVRNHLALALLGSLGLLIYLLWLIIWFFPGGGRTPMLVTVAGAVILGVAVLISRPGHRSTP